MAYDGGSSVRRRRRGGGGLPSPLAIFGSRLMWWHDASDISTLFQDSTFITPVAALNDPMGGVLDKSGKGNHAKQATSASRPLWKQDGNGCFNGLMDGVDDSWATAAIDLSASDKIAVFAAVRKLSDAGRGIAYEFSADINSNNGAFTLEAPDANGANTYRVRSKGTVIATASVGGNVAPITSVISQINDISADSLIVRINGAVAATASSDQGTGNFGNYPLYIGCRGGTSLRFNGAFYQDFGVLGAVTAGEIAAAEAYLNSKCKAY